MNAGDVFQIIALFVAFCALARHFAEIGGPQ